MEQPPEGSSFKDSDLAKIGGDTVVLPPHAGSRGSIEIESAESAENDSHRSYEILLNEIEQREWDRWRKIFHIGMGTTSFFGITGVICYITHIIVGHDSNTTIFSWNENLNLHAVLMMSMFVFLHGYAILIYRIIHTYTRYQMMWVHFGLQWVVFIGGVFGLLSMWAYREEFLKKTIPKPKHVHLISTHSWLGFVSIALYVSQFSGGIIFFVLGVMPNRMQITALTPHKYLGAMTFILCSITAMLGTAYGQRYNVRQFDSDELFRKVSVISLSLFSAGVIFLLTTYNFRRRPRPTTIDTRQSVKTILN